MTEGFAFDILFGILLFVSGSCIFSFLNVIIYRMPRKMQFWKGCSTCLACGKNLRARDLIPIGSYLALSGKCRCCGAKIRFRDTLVELLGGVLALICVWYWRGTPVTALLIFMFFCILTVVTFIDIGDKEIPDGCWIAIIVLTLISYGMFFLAPEGVLLEISAQESFPAVSLFSRLIGMISTSLPMLLLTLAIPGAFGGGDIKLMAACGLFLGWRLTLVSFILALAAGGLWGISLVASKKKGRKEHFAFGPFLCVGMVLGIVFGDQLIQWFFN